MSAERRRLEERARVAGLAWMTAIAKGAHTPEEERAYRASLEADEALEAYDAIHVPEDE